MTNCTVTKALLLAILIACGQSEYDIAETAEIQNVVPCNVRPVARANVGGALLNLTYTDSFPSVECRSTNLGFEMLHDALNSYKTEKGSYPDSLLRVLDLHSDVPALTPKYSWLLDGWGTPFTYRIEGDGYVLISAGPDRQLDTRDDLVDSTHSNR